MKKTHTRLVEKYIQLLKQKGIAVSDAYVFGSQVKGTARPGSDIDVCIISPRFGKNRKRERMMLMKYGELISDDIEPHPYSPEDFKVPYDLLASEIKRTGIRITA